jgi:hypothetical protein
MITKLTGTVLLAALFIISCSKSDNPAVTSKQDRNFTGAGNEMRN